MFNTNNLIKHSELNGLVEDKVTFTYDGKEYFVEDAMPGSTFLLMFKNKNGDDIKRVAGIADRAKKEIIPMNLSTLKALESHGVFYTPEAFKTGIKISLSKEIVDHGMALKGEAINLTNKLAFFSKTKKEKIEKVKKVASSGAIRKELWDDGSITVTIDLTFCKKVMEGGLGLAHSFMDKVVGLVSIMNSFGENDFNSFLKEADKRDKDLK